MRKAAAILLLTAGLLGAGSVLGREAEEPPRGRFGFALIGTEDGKRLTADQLLGDNSCAACHPRQTAETKGGLHAGAHIDPLYRSFALLARKEVGDEMYTFCSACHSPLGVVTGAIPGTPEGELPGFAKEGVGCDACHLIRRETGFLGPWGEPGNASFVLAPGPARFGTVGDIASSPAHEGEKVELYGTSEYCAACHTIIHPLNGIRLEHTYDEWKKSVYAEKGIQCQDCHMASVADAVEVAKTLTPKRIRGTFIPNGAEREIRPHTFVGGNVHSGRLAGGTSQGRMARERLKSAAELSVEAPESAPPGAKLSFTVVVTNVAAGHALPTSLTELREMWVELTVSAPGGDVLLETGDLDDEGFIKDGAIRFGTIVLDAEGVRTWRPWEASKIGYKRLVPPKGSEKEVVEVDLPEGLTGEVRIDARLLYRIAPPAVVKEVMGKEAFVPEIVEMAAADAKVKISAE